MISKKSRAQPSTVASGRNGIERNISRPIPATAISVGEASTVTVRRDVPCRHHVNAVLYH